MEGDRISLMLPSTVAARETAEREERDLRDLLRSNRTGSHDAGLGNLGSLFDAALK